MSLELPKTTRHDFGHGTGLIQEVTQALGDAPIDLVCQPTAEKPGRNGGFMVENADFTKGNGGFMMEKYGNMLNSPREMVIFYDVLIGSRVDSGD